MSRVVHFEIPAKDPGKAAEFYGSVFGWKIERWGEVPYWLITTGKAPEPGIDGAIAPKGMRISETTNTISVPDLDEYLKKVVGAGGKVAAPKAEVMGIGWLAYCTDPEGNLFGLMQMSPAAKAPK
jgi:predicted enzyme related to lactoylglutathione lyase